MKQEQKGERVQTLFIINLYTLSKGEINESLVNKMNSEVPLDPPLFYTIFYLSKDNKVEKAVSKFNKQS